MILTAKQVALREYYQEVFKEWEALDNNLQNVFTPYDLCDKMIDKVCKYCELKGKKILVTNLEFAIVLIERGIDPKDICFLTDCEQKAKFGQKIGVEIMSDDFFDFFEKVQEKKEVRTWDCVIENPPYQNPKNKHKSLWQRFVEMGFNIANDGGIISFIHPSAWRKPNHPLYSVFQDKQLEYLEIHNQSDGQKTFGCGTRYDWYVLINKAKKNDTIILDEDGVSKKIDMSSKPFIPHKHSEVLEKCIGGKGEKRIKVIHSRSMYGNDKPWMSKEKDDKFLYPCIYSTPCGKPPVLLYSSKKDGHFGVKKVVLGKASPENCFYDEKGEYGVTNNCIAIEVDSTKEAENIIAAIRSEKFIEMMDICKWSGFSIEPEVFEFFKKDFWKEFVQ